jgi:hypothetical protein
MGDPAISTRAAEENAAVKSDGFELRNPASSAARLGAAPFRLSNPATARFRASIALPRPQETQKYIDQTVSRSVEIGVVAQSADLILVKAGMRGRRRAGSRGESQSAAATG